MGKIDQDLQFFLGAVAALSLVGARLPFTLKIPEEGRTDGASL
jgi:hypothetical protein